MLKLCDVCLLGFYRTSEVSANDFPLAQPHQFEYHLEKKFPP